MRKTIAESTFISWSLVKNLVYSRANPSPPATEFLFLHERANLSDSRMHVRMYVSSYRSFVHCAAGKRRGWSEYIIEWKSELEMKVKQRCFSDRNRKQPVSRGRCAEKEGRRSGQRRAGCCRYCPRIERNVFAECSHVSIMRQSPCDERNLGQGTLMSRLVLCSTSCSQMEIDFPRVYHGLAFVCRNSKQFTRQGQTSIFYGPPRQVNGTETFL